MYSYVLYSNYALPTNPRRRYAKALPHLLAPSFRERGAHITVFCVLSGKAAFFLIATGAGDRLQRRHYSPTHPYRATSDLGCRAIVTCVCHQLSIVPMSAQLSFRRLDQRNQKDRDDWRDVFRKTPSFTYATSGRTPTDLDADRMFETVPTGTAEENVFLYSIYTGELLCGIAYLAKDYPKAGEANLVLLVLAESFHGRWLGVRAVKWLAVSAKSMGC